MTIEEAIAIIQNIYLSDESDERKKHAIGKVLNTAKNITTIHKMNLINNLSKQEVLNALDWLYAQQ